MAASAARALPTGFKRCDAHIIAHRGTTTCAFAENVFYEYWSSGEASSIRAYSPATAITYDVVCATPGGQISCEAGDGAAVRFSQSSVDAYSQDQADAFAASHDVGSSATDTATSPDSTSSDGAGTADTSSDGCDPAYVGACVPNDGADYDCAEIDGADFESVGDDPDRLDADGDGIACES